MKKEDLFEAMGQIDEKYVEDAHTPAEQRPLWQKWAAAAACFGIVFAGALAYRIWTVPAAVDGTNTTATSENTTAEDAVTENTMAYGMKLEGDDVFYFPISFEDRIRYGLVPEDAVGLTKENTYKITEADLGECMGEVAVCGDESVIGCSVYRFAKYPELDSICIVDLGGVYDFYTADGIDLDLDEGHSADMVLEAYDMPDSVTRMELQNGAGETLKIIDDREVIEGFCAAMMGKTDMGLQAHEQLLADVWKEAYGNEDVYYNGEWMVYASDADYDKAHDLWSAGELEVWLETERGFRLNFLYTPASRSISGYGYYLLTGQEVEVLSRLLGVEIE